MAGDDLDDVGGVDLDTAIVEWVGRSVGAPDPALYQRLMRPQTVPHPAPPHPRAGKEQLSRPRSSVG